MRGSPWRRAALARRRAALCGRERATAYTSRSKRGSGLKRSSPGLDSGWNGARGSTAASPAANPRRGIAGESETRATVLGLDCGLAVEVHQGTRNPLGRLAGFEGGFCGVLHGEGRRCGEDAHRSECSRRCQGLRATLTRQKGSAGGGCPHRVLERAERDAEGGRRRGRAETAGRRWWRGRKRAVSCVLDPRADSGRCCEGEPEIREVQGSLRREKFSGARTHRRRCTGQFLVLQGWGRATVGSEVFLAAGRSSCDGSRDLGSGGVE